MIKELSSECSSGICFMSTRQMRNAAVRMYPIGVNEGKNGTFLGLAARWKDRGRQHACWIHAAGFGEETLFQWKRSDIESKCHRTRCSHDAPKLRLEIVPPRIAHFKMSVSRPGSILGSVSTSPDVPRQVTVLCSDHGRVRDDNGGTYPNETSVPAVLFWVTWLNGHRV